MHRLCMNPHVEVVKCKRKKNFPNSKLPVIIYKGALELTGAKNKSAKIVEDIFLRNGWSNSWRNGIYDFHHYHSTTHECMAIVRGNASVILGGPGGAKLKLSKGDVIILPAGAGHKCQRHDKDFLCVGAYPQGKDYDINHGKKSEYVEALTRIKKLSIPRKDPVFGKEGFLKSYWK
jgi:uncharacterized protein YjlB